MHKVKRAIIMAAGEGKRLHPITLTIPKPLVLVNGTAMIETVIQALHKNGITEIYVVVGYLKEKFYEFEKKYCGLKIVENPYYQECNNISSLYVVRDYLEDAIILDGDQIIFNSEILRPEFEKSGYNAIWTENQTDEWLMQLEGDKVVSCSRDGGKNGWQLYSVSRWTQEDGIKLKHHLEYEFEKQNNRMIYWDDVVMFCHFNEYDLGIMAMNEGDIVEIDSISDLIHVDESYINQLGGEHERK